MPTRGSLQVKVGLSASSPSSVRSLLVMSRTGAAVGQHPARVDRKLGHRSVNVAAIGPQGEFGGEGRSGLGSSSATRDKCSTRADGRGGGVPRAPARVASADRSLTVCEESEPPAGYTPGRQAEDRARLLRPPVRGSGWGRASATSVRRVLGMSPA